MSIQLNQVTKKYAEDSILENISLKINDHEHIGIIGENGCGKSTLLKIIAGLENIQQGEVILSKNTQIAYLNQTFDYFDGNVEEFLLDSFQELNELQNRMHEYEQQISRCLNEQEMNKLLGQYGRICERFECAGGYEVTTHLQQITSGLTISHLCDRPYNTLSGGEKMRVHLAKLLLQKPNVLLLDEPTNHLDFAGIIWLENYLNSLAAIVIIVSHDRTFLNHTVSRLLEIECGEITNYIGNYDTYKKEKALLLERLRDDYEQQQKLITKLQNSIRRYRQWGNESDNEKFYKKAKQLERKLEAIERLKLPKANQREMQIALKECERSANDVLICHDLSKQFGEKVVLNHTEFSLYWQNRVAIAGDNGCGKSTFLKAILQEIALDSGEIKIGSRVKIGYLPQMITYENDKMRLIDYFIKNASLSEENARRYLHKFGFSHVDMPKWLKHLSGGESVRLKLALILLEGVNFIIFDEPTNHLDYQSIEIIEDLLQEFHGTLLIVSHDRMFIEKLCDVQITLQDGVFIY